MNWLFSILGVLLATSILLALFALILAL